MRKIVLACIATSVITLCLSHLTFEQAKADPIAGLNGFKISGARFDESEGGRKPDPVLPANWKLVCASNGGVNLTDLWFQDPAGNLFMVSGFNPDASPTFVLNEKIDEIPVAR